MTPEQELLVQLSFQKAVETTGATAVLFYRRLFELDPILFHLFPADLEEQQRKLIGMLRTVVDHLDRPEVLQPELEALGSRHVSYGARAEDYDTVGRALLWALEQSLGATFTPEVHDAWAATYAMITAAMQRGARVAGAEPH